MAQESLMSMHIHQQSIIRIGSSDSVGYLKAGIMGRGQGDTFATGGIPVPIIIIPNNWRFRIFIYKIIIMFACIT